jgi:hypothetical protein
MNTISKEQKSNLAKLLATENLNVEHRKVKTAHFVPKTRTLCLPIWDNMSNDLYDLLCGHEVGHALWTPADETKLNEAKKKHNIPHSYMNVIEDIRIDKKMKLKYPGLRKSYFNGYKELVARDFFGKIGDEANNMRFIDRLNVFTKSGHLENTIEFNDQEKSFIEKSNHLETFDDVIDLAKQIFAYSKEENYDKEKDPLFQQLKEIEQDKLDQDEQDNQSEQSESEDSQDPSDEKQSQSGGDEDTEKEEEKDNTTSGDDGNKTDEPENENKQKVDGNKGHMGSHNPEYQPEKITPSNSDGSLSDEMFKEAMKSLSNMSENIRDRRYVTLPSLSEEDVIISSKHVAKLYKDYYTKKYSSTPTMMANSLNRFKEWKKSQSGTISYMAKEFEMKKAADNYKKSLTSKTGIINMNKIHSYKFNDDIFKKIQIEPGAKNHGMIMFIDWSGSMSQNIDDTIKQTLNLVMFCKAVQIPFRVFAFSDITRAAFYKEDHDDYGYSSRAARDLKNNPFKHKHGDLFIENVNLIEWLSSDQKTPEYNENMLNLYRFGEYHTQYYNHRRHYDSYEEPIDMPSCMRLGGTPLDPAIVASLTIVKNFILKHKIQKMNTIFLTDGCGHSMYNTVTTTDKGNLELDYGSENADLVIKNPVTKKNYPYESHRFTKSTAVMFDMLRQSTGTNIVGFYVTSRNNASYYDISNFLPEGAGYDGVDAVRKQMRKDKVGTIVGTGYDELFIIPKKNLKIVDEEAKINPDMSIAKMKAEFGKTLKTKKISRVLLNKFVERVA